MARRNPKYTTSARTSEGTLPTVMSHLAAIANLHRLTNDKTAELIEDRCPNWQLWGNTPGTSAVSEISIAIRTSF